MVVAVRRRVLRWGRGGGRGGFVGGVVGSGDEEEDVAAKEEILVFVAKYKNSNFSHL